jgi:hypothetical protein
VNNLRIIGTAKSLSVLEVLKEASIYCEDDKIYIFHNRADIPSNADMTVVFVADLERRLASELEKYNNLLNGLNYWKDKAKK